MKVYRRSGNWLVGVPWWLAIFIWLFAFAIGLALLALAVAVALALLVAGGVTYLAGKAVRSRWPERGDRWAQSGRTLVTKPGSTISSLREHADTEPEPQQSQAIAPLKSPSAEPKPAGDAGSRVPRTATEAAAAPWVVLYQCDNGTEVPGDNRYATEDLARLGASKTRTLVVSDARLGVQGYDVIRVGAGPWRVVFECEDGSSVQDFARYATEEQAARVAAGAKVATVSGSSRAVRSYRLVRKD